MTIMKQTNSLLIALLLISPSLASSQKMEKEDAVVQPASYWQLNYGVPQNAYTYSISLQTENPEETGEEISKLARKTGVESGANQNSYYGQNSRNKTITFSASPDLAETFSQEVIKMGKLKQYSSSKSINESGYNEIKKKADLIRGELEGNKNLFETLPIAKALVMELSSRYKSYLSGYKSALNRASITINLITKQNE